MELDVIMGIMLKKLRLIPQSTPNLSLGAFWVNFKPIIMALIVFQLGGHPPAAHLMR